MTASDGAGRASRVHDKEPGPTISRTVEASAEDVWAVLADGWAYANWVVGAARIRDVDALWPAASSKIHHSFGLWPLLINDSTRVDSCVPESDLALIARGWPAGESRIRITVQPQGPGKCIVRMTEDAIAGPARLVPAVVRRLLFIPRNNETLHRLALIAEGRKANAKAA